jgi:hypothetical protein
MVVQELISPPPGPATASAGTLPTPQQPAAAGSGTAAGAAAAAADILSAVAATNIKITSRGKAYRGTCHLCDLCILYTGICKRCENYENLLD